MNQLEKISINPSKQFTELSAEGAPIEDLSATTQSDNSPHENLHLECLPATQIYPAELLLGRCRFELVTTGVDREWIDRADYLRVPGRTDEFVLYRFSDRLTRDQIIVGTPREILKYEALGNTPIARKVAPWAFTDLLDPTQLKVEQVLRQGHEVRKRYERVIGYDKITEGDSHRLFNYVASARNVQFPDEFWPVALLWLRDEVNHHSGFKAVYEQMFGVDSAREEALDNQPSDFAQFQPIMDDPFALLISLAYDEASTIAGYRHDFPLYHALGHGMSEFVRRVTADEGWHFSKFIDLAVRHFPHRLDEAKEILLRTSNLDGKEYKRTFFLDHDPSVESQFTEELKQISTATVLNTIEARRRNGLKVERQFHDDIFGTEDLIIKKELDREDNS